MARSTEQSRKLQKRAEQMIPGGVSSPVRAFGAVVASNHSLSVVKDRTSGTPTETNILIM